MLVLSENDYDAVYMYTYELDDEAAINKAVKQLDANGINIRMPLQEVCVGDGLSSVKPHTVIEIETVSPDAQDDETVSPTGSSDAQRGETVSPDAQDDETVSPTVLPDAQGGVSVSPVLPEINYSKLVKSHEAEKRDYQKELNETESDQLMDSEEQQRDGSDDVTAVKREEQQLVQ